MIGEGAQTTLSNALAPLQNFGKPSTGGIEKKLALAVMRVLRREKFLDREFDDCIVHPREGDEQLFEDFSDYVDALKGYVIIPIEEYSKLGGV